MTADRTVPQLRAFVEQGGTIVAIGGAATNLARHLGLPIENHLVENGQPLPQQKFYVPGSLLSARVDTSLATTAGLKAQTTSSSTTVRSGSWAPGRGRAGITPLAWFDSPTPLRSGWAWGQEYLRDGVIAVEAKVGKGRVLLYAPRFCSARSRIRPSSSCSMRFTDFIYNLPMTRKTFVVALAAVVGITAVAGARQAKEPVDAAAIAKIRDEGLNRSQTASMFSVLVDDIGPQAHRISCTQTLC